MYGRVCVCVCVCLYSLNSENQDKFFNKGSEDISGKWGHFRLSANFEELFGG